MTTTNEELWRVQLGTGELRVMSVDALDEAFQSGLVDGGTYVLAPGAHAWARLADVAGLDDATPEVEATPSLSPVALGADMPASSGDPYALADLSDDALRPRRGRALLFSGLGLAAAAALVVGLVVPRLGTTLGGVHPPKEMANAMQAPPPALDVTPAGVTFKKPDLTDEQKRLLLEADRAREKKEEERSKAKAAAPAKARKGGTRRAKGSQPFVNGGDKYDPLNGAL